MANLNDQDPTTQWVASLTTSLANNNAWAQLDFGAVVFVESLFWLGANGSPYPASSPTDYSVQISDDGASWSTVVSRTNPGPVVRGAEWLGVSARYVRLATTKVNDGTGWSLGLAELWAVGAPADAPDAGALAPAPPDTTSGIHVGLVFNYAVSNLSSESGVVDFVWGSSSASQPAGVFNSRYEPFDREPSGGNSLSWFQANHPDWVEYQCDRSSIAYEFGDPNVPLDIANPAVLGYLMQTYYAPAVQQGFAAIAFDNVNLDNGPHRCGHFDASGTWVQQFDGGTTDPAYHAAVLAWAQVMSAQLHALHASVVMNWSYDFGNLKDSDALAQYIDVDTDERGFSNYGSARAGYILGIDWLLNMQALQRLESLGRAWLSINEEPNPFSAITDEEKQWALANYLLVKGRHAYLFMCGVQEYGHLFIAPEYGAAIGEPVGAMYLSQGVFMRDFTHGLALVNPSASASFSVALPAGAYQDLHGNAVDALSLPSATGAVLLKR